MSFSKNQKTLHPNFGIIFTIENIQGEWIILKSSYGHQLPWPKHKLPGPYKIGDQIELTIKNNNESDSNYPVMRKLLEELIN